MAERPFRDLSEAELHERVEEAVRRPEYEEAVQLLEELSDRGWEQLRSDQPQELPGHWLTPVEAARFPVGSIARVASADFATMGGTPFKEGEELLVIESRLAPAGMVWLKLRSPEGREWLTAMVDGLEPGGWG